MLPRPYIVQSVHAESWKRKCRRIGIKINEVYLYSLQIVGDQTEFVEDTDDMSYGMINIGTEYVNCGLQIIMNKTEYMVAGTDRVDVEMNGTVMQHVKQKKYLGTTI